MDTKHTYKQIIIIPDVHGREFWKPIVAKYKNNKDVLIVFLGDYLDPYTSIENISHADALFNFMVLVNHAATADNIILLIGNHDLHYFPKFLYGHGCRRFEEAKYEICQIFDDNSDLFQVAYETYINDRKYLFTHAGVLTGWLNWLATQDEENHDEWDEEQEQDLQFYRSLKPDAQSLNQLTTCRAGLNALYSISIERSGPHPFGSCMWADVREHFMSETPVDDAGKPIYQIFGHTFSLPKLDEPYILENFAMLDCRKAFTLDCTTGKIAPYAKE